MKAAYVNHLLLFYVCEALLDPLPWDQRYNFRQPDAFLDQRDVRVLRQAQRLELSLCGLSVMEMTTLPHSARENRLN